MQCSVCGHPVADTDIIDHLEDKHPGALANVEAYAISWPDEQVTLERRHLERAPGETELMWLTRLARNVGYITSADLAPHGLGCLDCGVPFAPGFRYVQRLRQMTDSGPIVDIICLDCGRKQNLAGQLPDAARRSQAATASAHSSGCHCAACEILRGDHDGHLDDWLGDDDG